MDYRRILAFAKEHRGEDPMRLILQQSRYPDVDMKGVAQQLEGRNQAMTKWPFLVDKDDYFFPPKLNREQSSSEAAARYKSGITELKDKRVADLTGGMGVDSYFFSLGAKRVDYVEYDADLCAVAVHNFEALDRANVECHAGDCMQWIETQPKTFDLLYIDPARRDAQGRKVSAFENCQPNLLDNLDLLFTKASRVLVKASPMIDISLAVSQLKRVEAVYVVAVRGECKEVLFLCGQEVEEPTIHAVNLPAGYLENPDQVDDFFFTRKEESEAEVCYADQEGQYLYEPNAALMKAGAYQLLSQRFNLPKLDRNTHLYTSDELKVGFPGRVWYVERPLTLNKRSIQQYLPQKEAHVVTRNYPVPAAVLQKQLGVREGDPNYVVATTLKGKKVGFLCRLVAQCASD